MSVEVLFKYGRLNEHSESLFTSNSLWFASPQSLNDPFECRPWFEFAGTDEQVIAFIVRAVRRRNPGISDVDALANAIQLLRQDRHKNPKFWEFFRTDVVNLLSTNIAVCCLSTANSNILMWSHYAADHQGYCLGFEATEHTPFFGEAQKVTYSDAFPIVHFFDTPNDKQVDLIFLTKYAGWAYENEYRIVDHKAGAGLRTYPSELLKSVTFGLRMPEVDKQKIRTWLGTRNSKVRVFDASIHEREFKITTTEVT